MTDPVREKHVVNIGRWRVAFRFGRYKTGYHSRGLPHFTGALPFVWFSVIHRNKAAVRAFDSSASLESGT